MKYTYHTLDQQYREGRRNYERARDDDAAGGWDFERCPDCGRRLTGSLYNRDRKCPDVEYCGWEERDND